MKNRVLFCLGFYLLNFYLYHVNYGRSDVIYHDRFDRVHGSLSVRYNLYGDLDPDPYLYLFYLSARRLFLVYYHYSLAALATSSFFLQLMLVSDSSQIICYYLSIESCFPA
jgi:hypothetical protein